MDVTVYMPSRDAASRLTEDLPAGVKVDTSAPAQTPFQGMTWLVVLTLPDMALVQTQGPSNVYSQVLRSIHRLHGEVRTPDPA